MIITAALCWWNEPPEMLAGAVRSIANLADRVVALDGAYRRFPGATIASPREQAEVIRATAEEVGLDCLVLTPDRLWNGQLEKRSYLYRLAALGADWIVVVDADHRIHCDREVTRAELATVSTAYDVIQAPMRATLNPDRSVEDSAAAEWHRINAGTVTPQRLLFRALPGIQVEQRHWRVSAVKNGERVWLLYDDHKTANTTTLLSPYEIEHLGLFHPSDRVEAARTFYRDRAEIVERTGQEDDVVVPPRPPFHVTAALVWYDESPDDLEACVRGIAVACDRLVAVDGAYRRYPDAKVSSPPEQARRIRKVAKELGLPVEIIVPSELWDGQVAKRSFAYARAAEGSDWIAIFDTDWVASGDGQAVREELRGYTDVDVVAVKLYTPPGDLAATNWHAREAGAHSTTVHFLRALPELKVETLHWWISAMKDDQRVWLQFSQMATDRPILTQHVLNASYEIEHRTLLRDERHILAGRAFCNDRVKVLAQTGQEDHVPGLPEPVWDYTTVPY